MTSCKPVRVLQSTTNPQPDLIALKTCGVYYNFIRLMFLPCKGVLSACCRLHSMERLTAMLVLLTTSAWLLFAMPQQVTAGYSVGVGIADVTGPTAEVGFVSTPTSWFRFMPALEPSCTCLPPTTRAVANSVQDLGARSGVHGVCRWANNFQLLKHLAAVLFTVGLSLLLDCLT